jgi:hypothetical protein
MMLKRNTFITIISMAVFVALGAVSKPASEFKNLQILPQDITEQKLDSIMHSYNIALGVTCKFCHATFPANPFSFDYPADTNPMKSNARDMLRMNININKTWFNFDSTKRAEYLNTITCITCHRGEPYPQIH